jgi:glycine cleavage system transcriptional repressor
MKKIVVFVLGPDRPGIIAKISKILFLLGCNLEDVSQTILQGEFTGIFITTMSDSSDENGVLVSLRSELEPLGLFVHLKPMLNSGESQREPVESFIITTVGPDKPGLIAGISEVLAHYKVNITNLKAVSAIHGDPPHYITIYEVDIPPEMDYHILRNALYERARQLGQDINIQHRDIFEQIHRV